jgi:imidazolonepropionase-like amidohydrolase
LLILRGGTVWPGTGPEVLPDHDVIINASTIESVRPSAAGGPSERLPVDAAAEVLDCRGKWVIPGLIDLHVHLVWCGGLDPVAPLVSEDPLMTAYRAADNARRTLRAGITTVRDLGANADITLHLARAVSQGLVPGPRIIACGRTVVMTGGHDPFWGNMADGPSGVLRATREQIYAGATVIKVSATGGAYGRSEGEDVGASELNQDELAVIASEAHKFGLRVAAHAIGEEGIRNSLMAGIDCIEHGHYLTPELLDYMMANGRAWVPTLYTYQNLATGDGIPAYAQRKAQAIVGRHLTAFAEGQRRGVLIGAGSDAGSPSMPHPTLDRELLSLVAAGMLPWQALAAATSVAATILGRHGAGLGEVKAGMTADLVVLDRDPLADVGNVRAVSRVLQGGRPV